MRMSRLFLRTLRDDPADAEVDSHRLLVRAGYIRKVAAGIYTWLPLGHRVLRRAEQIVREEMDAASAQELLLPIIQPLELWQRTGREKAYGPLMFRLTDRKDTGFALAPTAEEVITITGPVEAQAGEIGGDVNHEFMAVAAVGEDDFVWCRACDYAANVEAAVRAAPPALGDDPPMPGPLEAEHTPDLPGIKGVAEFLGVEPGRMLKCIAFDV